MFLFSVSISSEYFDAEDDFTKTAIKVQDIWQMGGLSENIYEDYARQCFIEWFKEQERSY